MHWMDDFPPLSEDIRNQILTYRGNPVFDLLGIQIERVEPGRAWLSLPFKKELTHSGGIVQGGIVTALADAAIAFAVLTVIYGKPVDFTSVDLKMNFIRPMAKGVMRAEGGLVHMGKRTAVGEAMIFNDAGKPVAKCLSSIMLLERGYMPSHAKKTE